MKIRNLTAIGAALNDLLLRESDAYLAGLGREKGGMTLVDDAEIELALAKSAKRPESVPGGSACNTAVGFARLGGESRFIGKRGEDATGLAIERQLAAWSVTPTLRRAKGPTGRVLSVITPDAQRSMLTSLAAAASFGPEDLSARDFEGVDLVHLEGYLLFNAEGRLMDRILELAKASGARVSLDLSSFQVAQIFKDKLSGIIDRDLDLLIANEDEAKAFTGKAPEASLTELARRVKLVVVKLGADGVLVAEGGRELRIKGRKAKAIDTTGAGDLWASGFLRGLSLGWDLEASATLGNRMGAAVVEVVGAVIPDPVYGAIRAEFALPPR